MNTSDPKTGATRSLCANRSACLLAQTANTDPAPQFAEADDDAPLYTAEVAMEGLRSFLRAWQIHRAVQHLEFCHRFSCVGSEWAELIPARLDVTAALPPKEQGERQ